ncbi:MAG: MFS transporter [Promethearchaeota archaeon]|nr:MAG: MFS transporter [Candidatus Lokiarchaeota archaeon]
MLRQIPLWKKLKMFSQKNKLTANKSIESSEFKYKLSFKLLKKNEKRSVKKFNYIGFFLLYFAISVIRIYLVVYLPVFLLNILFIDRSQLAFIQIFVYLVMFSGPVLGYLFDRYSKNKKLILISSSILFLVSFLLSVFGGRNLGVFGLFLALNLLSQEVVKVGVSKMIIDHFSSEGVKDGNLAAINISCNVGSFIPSLLFLFTVSDILNVNQWNGFFFMGFLFSLPIILSTVLLRETTDKPEKNLEQREKNTISLGGNNTLNLILLFLSYLLIWSDKLYQFPFSSWVLTRFGEEGFNIYSLLYIVLILLNIGGVVIGQRISNKETNKIDKIMANNRNKLDLEYNNQDEILYAFKLSNRKKIIAITVGIYAVLTFLMAISDFLFLMIIQGIIQVIAGVMMLNYTSLMMTISNNGKYKTFTFQCLKMAYALSCVIFLPLGTYFSAFIQIETLFITVGILAMLSVIPLALMKVKSNN